MCIRDSQRRVRGRMRPAMALLVAIAMVATTEASPWEGSPMYSARELRQTVPPSDAHEVNAAMPSLPIPATEPDMSALDARLASNAGDVQLALVSLQEAARSAAARRGARIKANRKKRQLTAVAAVLEKQLSLARSKTSVLERQERRWQDRTRGPWLSTATMRKQRRNKARVIQSSVQRKYLKAEHRYAAAKQQAATMEDEAARAAKYKLKMAHDRAKDIVRRAKARAAAVEAQAQEEAQAQRSKARGDERELEEDARAELASTRRKLVRASDLVDKTDKLYHKVEGEGWTLVSHSQQLRRAVEAARAAEEVRASHLDKIQRQIKALG
eukprot:TRINITY_DN7698_c0_g1_i1.p1 TRINITY_DN7698_c0_g1~~TRINITY_DN7698_c0_g1_i1.p1  ORF type:complete len:328 (-),score=102.75 TRINITY_DN7698_c0_g1_i1:533-1516(-)